MLVRERAPPSTGDTLAGVGPSPSNLQTAIPARLVESPSLGRSRKALSVWRAPVTLYDHRVAIAERQLDALDIWPSADELNERLASGGLVLLPDDVSEIEGETGGQLQRGCARPPDRR